MTRNEFIQRAIIAMAGNPALSDDAKSQLCTTDIISEAQILARDVEESGIVYFKPDV